MTDKKVFDVLDFFESMIAFCLTKILGGFCFGVGLWLAFKIFP